MSKGQDGKPGRQGDDGAGDSRGAQGQAQKSKHSFTWEPPVHRASCRSTQWTVQGLNSGTAG